MMTDSLESKPATKQDNNNLLSAFKEIKHVEPKSDSSWILMEGLLRLWLFWGKEQMQKLLNYSYLLNSYQSLLSLVFSQLIIKNKKREMDFLVELFLWPSSER